ncbi:uncharacterized protein BJ212DRAFT_1383079 [Suillus subaureus]|uniref:Uncharacterized protein n=1 Tax=Suillus subaureus TaxID=48587 RepID=A0A9P7E1H2_9AGAM|nr:uncharacterized protein BJ212DRAFT_1383079 [Suillus subaureus]KAG1808375.1 hypothetical protein BJ212DRAFT_1383079 [Suillus subaureus]
MLRVLSSSKANFWPRSYSLAFNYSRSRQIFRVSMYPNAQEQGALQAAENLMNETMARYDPSHDAFHVQRVRKTALSIARALSAQQPDLLEAEAADPYGYFLPFFQSLSSEHGLDLISDGRARQVVKVVENVSWTTEKELRSTGKIEEWHRVCVELHCVQDADRLDAIGAFGIMRCAAYSAAVNRPLHAPPGRLDTAVQHFYDKLLHIQERLKTEPGKQMGAKRHQFIVDFLNSVENEYNAEALEVACTA